MRTEKKAAAAAAAVSDIRTMPHSDEMERAVLGAVMIDNRCFATCAGWVSKRSFYRPSHRLTWDAMVALQAAQSPIDELTLTDYFHARGQLEDIGGVAYFRELAR